MPIEAVAKEHITAGVVPLAPWRIRTASVLPGYRISVTCNDGASGIVDLSGLVASEQAGIFAALKDEKLFNQVFIDLGVLVWPNGADLDPAWVHDEIVRNNIWVVPD